MNESNPRFKILIVLLGIAFFFLLTNIFIERQAEEADKTAPRQSQKLIPVTKIFESVLESYGLDVNWVEVDDKNKPVEYNITLPADIYPVYLLSDIFEKFARYNEIKVSSGEKEVNGSTSLNITYMGEIVIAAGIKRDAEKYRHKPCLSFLVKMDEPYRLQGAPESYSAGVSYLIRPGEEFGPVADTLHHYGIEYSLLMDDNADYSGYDLTGGGKNELKTAIKNIVDDFKHTSRYYYDSRSELANSVHFNFIKDEFGKLGVRLVNIRSVTLLEPKTDSDIVSLFRFYYRSLGPGENKEFLIDRNNMNKLKTEIKRIGKKGYTFGCG